MESQNILERFTRINNVGQVIQSIQNNEFLRQCQSYSSAEIFSGTPIDFEFNRNNGGKKIPPILELARPENALDIVKTYREIYGGTYPYKEMEEVKEIIKLIEDPSVRWVLFIDPRTYEIAGCVTFVHDFFNKRGYVRGFMVREEFRGRIDTVKAMIGSMYGTYDNFKGKILSWYAENRTAHSSSQYPMCLCGLYPIGFYPNKDVFFNEIESDLMQIIYDKRAFTYWRTEYCPSVIPEVQDCYEYSLRKYPIHKINFQSPKIQLNKREIIKLKSRIKKTFTTDAFGYHYITLHYLGSDSYFKFLYTPQVQNFEKTEYAVENNEQLYVFIQDFMMLKRILNVRYCEAFVSAYKPEHQKVFYRAGLKPRGYVPCWKYNDHTKKLEDYILFNCYEGKISKNIKLIEEGKTLLNYLNIEI